VGVQRQLTTRQLADNPFRCHSLTGGRRCGEGGVGVKRSEAVKMVKLRTDGGKSRVARKTNPRKSNSVLTKKEIKKV